MIVLRIRLDGVTIDHRLERGSATLGAGSRATIRSTNAGWPGLAATLRQEGAEVRMIVPGRVGTVTLRVGDEVRLGRADLSIVGLLPAEEDAPVSPADGAVWSAAPPVSPPAPTSAPTAAAPAAGPGVPVFGDYAEAAAPRFALDGPLRAAAPAGAAPPSLPNARPAPPTAAPRAPAPVAATSTPPALLPPQAAPAPRAAGVLTRPPHASAWDGPPQDFGTELFDQVKRAPWFAVSIAMHVLVFLLLSRFWVVPADPTAVRLGGGSLAGSLLPEQSFEGTPPREDPEEHEVLPPSPPAPEVPTPFEPTPETSSDAVPMPLEVQPEPAHPSDLGTQPTLSAAGRRTTPRSAPRKAEAPHEDLHETFAKGAAHAARKRAAQFVLDALGVDKGGPGARLKTLAGSEVLVVEGEWDHHERVLGELGIAHTKISPYDTALAGGSALDQPRFLFWNCGDRLNPRHIARIAPRVRKFVEQGGYLFTSDWALDNVVKPAFPGYVDTRGNSAPLPEVVLDIAPTRAGAGHPLLEGVFQPGLTGRWWLEQASHDIVIKKPGEILVLIESPQLRDLYSRSPAMAFTFAHGKGRVLHVLGHYDQEEGNIAGTIAVQRIALNFLLMGLGALKDPQQERGK